MTIYTGRSADGSDMKEFEGVYTNPDNPDEWQSKPYPSQRRWMSKKREIESYANRNNLTIEEIYQEIKDKSSKLSYKQREWVKEYMS